MLHFQDEPVHSINAVIGYQLMKLASDHGVRVVYNGQGADETLAGYPSYFESYWQELIWQGKVLTSWREMSRYSDVHAWPMGQLVARQVRVAISRILSLTHAYRQRRAMREHQRHLRNEWLQEDFKNLLQPPSELRTAVNLNKELQRSVEIAPLPLYLRIEDRNSMAHSVEARSPFMDYRLVSLAFHLRTDFRLRGPYNKYIVRYAMKDRIPQSVLRRVNKFGFPTPVDSWFRGPLAPAMEEFLQDNRDAVKDVFNLTAVRRDFAKHLKGEINVGAKLFDVVQIGMWLRAANN
jgi:asparagine synthase (glutamine-hydrolysing)